MRLIFLSWCYPPMRYPRAVQVARLARYTKHRPLDVFCLGEGRAPAESLEGVRVTRISAALPTRLLAPRLPGRYREALFSLDTALFWWRRAARRIARDCAPGPGDVLVTFGQPMADHLAGLRLKRAFGLNWFAHFSDPWADNPFLSASAQKRARAREAAVVEAADKLIFTSPETVDMVMRKYPESMRQKTAVLPHGFEGDLYPPLSAPEGPLVLRYLGNFYGARGPAPLFEALALLQRRDPGLLGRVRVELIGNAPRDVRQSPALASLPAGTVRVRDPVDYMESLALMRSADLLMVIDAPFSQSVFLPSKLVDYIGAERPVFGITPEGTASRVIRELGGRSADPRDPGHVARELAAALNEVEAFRGAPWGDPGIRRRYAAATVAAEFDALLDSLPCAEAA